jgi:hypothetical protein
MIISINGKNTFDKIQHCFMIKALKKLRIEGMLPNIIRAICDNPVNKGYI